MTIEGVDYSWGQPTAAALKAAGKKFACRYLPYSFNGVTDGGKGLAYGEALDLHHYGIDIVLNFEWYAGRMRVGYNAGVTDAKASAAAFKNLGIPSTLPIYFSADFDATSKDYPAIDAYLDGAASVLGRDRVGIYAEYAVIRHVQGNGKARWFWQTYAWSGGQTAPGIHIKQYLNGQKINGAPVDLDRAYVADFGQWQAPGNITLPESDTEGSVGLNLRLYATNDSNPYPDLGTAVIVGTGHDLIRVSDGKPKVSNVADGSPLGVVQRGQVVTAVSGMFAAGEECVAYNVAGELCVSPMRDVKFTALLDPTPFSQKDVDAKVATATADLQSQLASATATCDTRVAAAVADTKASAKVVVSFG